MHEIIQRELEHEQSLSRGARVATRGREASLSRRLQSAPPRARGAYMARGIYVQQSGQGRTAGLNF